MSTTPRPSFKQRLRGGGRLVGVRTQFCSPVVVEALGWCGFDYVYIDMEHAPNDLMSVVAQCHALGECDAVPVVRLPNNAPVLIQQMLDAGIENIVVPMVETPEEAAMAVAATRFPPRGIRSAAKAHRGNRYGAIADYEATVDERICLVVQIESRAAVGRIAEIAAVEGVDGLLFGPADLAADMGRLGSADHEEVTQLIAGAVPSILAAGKLAGMSLSNPARAQLWLDRGCSFVSVGGDIQMLVTAARKASAQARAET